MEELVGNLILPVSATMIELYFDSDIYPPSPNFYTAVKYFKTCPGQPQLVWVLDYGLGGD